MGLRALPARDEARLRRRGRRPLRDPLRELAPVPEGRSLGLLLRRRDGRALQRRLTRGHPGVRARPRAFRALAQAALSRRPAPGGLGLGLGAAVVGDGVAEVEEPAEAALARRRDVVDPDLLRVWVDADVRRVLLAGHQQPDEAVRPVLVAMHPALAAWEGANCALACVLPAGWRA